MWRFMSRYDCSSPPRWRAALPGAHAGPEIIDGRACHTDSMAELHLPDQHDRSACGDRPGGVDNRRPSRGPADHRPAPGRCDVLRASACFEKLPHGAAVGRPWSTRCPELSCSRGRTGSPARVISRHSNEEQHERTTTMSGLGGSTSHPTGGHSLVQLQLPVVTHRETSRRRPRKSAHGGQGTAQYANDGPRGFPEYSLHGLSMDTNEEIIV